ncbi:hypothetical protein BDR06DRAFT_976116 [Suillus hirtellus]|nr:hypothetical protein BDR06DRAFT_976116 [Suillus hirtellus]
MQKFVGTVSSALKALLKGPTWLLWTLFSIFKSRSRPPPRPNTVNPLSLINPLPLIDLLPLINLLPLIDPLLFINPLPLIDLLPLNNLLSLINPVPFINPLPLINRPHPISLIANQAYNFMHNLRPSHIPQCCLLTFATQRSRHPSGPDLPTRTPQIVVTPIEIDPYEDAVSLRRKARIEGDRMEECSKQSREAYADKNGARAKQLSLKREAHKDNMTRLDKAASTKIFEEAKLHFDNAVQEVRNHEELSLRVIVGKGNHSENNIPKIKVAIQERARSLGLGVEVDPLNEGCLVYNKCFGIFHSVLSTGDWSWCSAAM